MAEMQITAQAIMQTAIKDANGRYELWQLKPEQAPDHVIWHPAFHPSKLNLSSTQYSFGMQETNTLNYRTSR